jgi:hypothetical protein
MGGGAHTMHGGDEKYVQSFSLKIWKKRPIGDIDVILTVILKHGVSAAMDALGSAKCKAKLLWPASQQWLV